ncbi:hypothetical protein [Methylorubrum sp. GM97]|uniref:hypothetical protein n=1 Tax=Methylorubrum sp. GM97 TaxID=2938232 RepID=UPI0021881BCF|nr:hypothetical protein [Methylorubrum sp. GM97]BDL41081.1 hypothetical protein MSPGM_36710 [Methylorubrum sp. GM97]
MQNLHRPVSNRGQWHDTLTIYANGLPDPSQTVFTFNAWPTDARPGGSDYGWSRSGAGYFVLAASTDDETGRLAVAVNGSSLVVTWLFPPNQMSGLAAGSYEGCIGAWIGDEMAEIEPFRFVVQTRGINDGGRSASVAEAVPAGGGGTITAIVDGGEI